MSIYLMDFHLFPSSINMKWKKKKIDMIQPHTTASISFVISLSKSLYSACMKEVKETKEKWNTKGFEMNYEMHICFSLVLEHVVKLEMSKLIPFPIFLFQYKFKFKFFDTWFLVYVYKRITFSRIYSISISVWQRKLCKKNKTFLWIITIIMLQTLFTIFIQYNGDICCSGNFFNFWSEHLFFLSLSRAMECIFMKTHKRMEWRWINFQ